MKALLFMLLLCGLQASAASLVVYPEPEARLKDDAETLSPSGEISNINTKPGVNESTGLPEVQLLINTTNPSVVCFVQKSVAESHGLTFGDILAAAREKNVRLFCIGQYAVHIGIEENFQ